MKNIMFLIIVLAGMSHSYCEYGREQKREFVSGGYYVTYIFSNNKTIGIKYHYGDMIPYQIQFDFYSMEQCR